MGNAAVLKYNPAGSKSVTVANVHFLWFCRSRGYCVQLDECLGFTYCVLSVIDKYNDAH